MDDRVEIRRAELSVRRAALPALGDFYADWGLSGARTEASVAIKVATSALVFVGRARPSFHHFAFRVPGNRFQAAQAWLAERSQLLTLPAQPEPTFEFDNLDAVACYVLDPAGNIVELIAFRDLDRVQRTEAFSARELVGIAEVGMVVTDRSAVTRAFADQDLHAWSGSSDRDDLQFIGRRGSSVILASPGRGWLPTDRPAELAEGSVVTTHNGRVVRFDLNDGVMTSHSVA